MNTNPNHQNLKASGDLPVTLAGRVFCDADPLGAVPGGNTPTPADLQAFAQTGMPHEAAVETISRLIDLFPHLPQDCGLVGLAALADSEGREFGAVLLLPGPSASANTPLHMIPYAEIHQTFDNHPDAGHAIKYPLTPLVHAWRRRAEPAPPDKRRILPGKLGMAPEGDRRVPKLYTPAAHVPDDGQAPLPGFANTSWPAVALPLELWRLGGGPDRSSGRGLPIPLRLFLAALLHTKQADRHGQHILDLSISLREVRRLLYPNGPPSNKQFWPAFRRAVDALRTADGIPIWREDTQTWALRQIVTVPEIPAGPTELDGPVIFRIDLPPGSENGPMVAPSLLHWAANDAPAARLLLNLAYYWNRPGVSLRQAGNRADGQGRFYHQSNNPADYAPVSDDELAAWAYPDDHRKNRRNLRKDAREIRDVLASAGELRIVEGRILPPEGYRNPDNGGRPT